MRRLLTLCAVLLPAGVVCPLTAERWEPRVHVTQVANDVYVFEAGPDGYVSNQNSIAVVNESDVLVFDSNTRPSLAKAVISEIRKITDKPVRWLINSHHHPDHWSGNEVYAKEFPGIQIVSSEQTREFMKRVSPAWPTVFAATLKRSKAAAAEAARTGKSADGTPYTATDRAADDEQLDRYASFLEETTTLRRVFPDLVYNERMTIRSGTREFQLFALSGDATGATALYMPREKVMLVGDLLAYPTQWGANSYALSPWIDSLRLLSRLDAGVVVAGHGSPFRDKTYLNLVLEFFEALRREVNKALEAGAIAFAEVQKAVDLSDFRLRFKALGANFTDVPLRMAFREGRDGREFQR